MHSSDLQTGAWTNSDPGKLHVLRCIGLAAMLAGGGLVAMAQAAEPAAAEIARRSAAVDRIEAWKATVEIVDAMNNQVQRRRRGDIGTRHPDGSADTQRYYRFSSPQDIRGTVLLIHEHPAAQDDIWLFLPSVGKPRRIAGSAKKNSFVGTQYTFADLTSFEHARYRHSLAGTEDCADHQCWVLESVPLDEGYARDIGYSKQRSWVQQDTYRMVRIDYYDPAGALLKTQTLGEFAQAAGDKALALARTMVNHRNGQRTSIRMSNADFKPSHGDADFSAQRLGAD